MNQDNKRELFEKMPMNQALFKMALPTIISQLITLVYNIVDTFFIGRTGNPYMVASVSLSLPVFMFTVAISNIFGVGGGSLIARLSGKGEETFAKYVSAYSFVFAAITALCYSLIVFLFLTPLLRFLGASDNTIGFAKQYMILVVVLGNIPAIISATLAHLLRNAGYSKQASLGLSLGGVINIALDPLLMFVIFPRGSEVIGAALATLVSNLISCTFLVTVVLKVSSSSSLSLSPKNALKIRKSDIKALYSVGIPSGFLNALYDVSSMVLNAIMATHGDLCLAAIGIVLKIERLPTAINIGICQGMMPLVAYNYASGNRERMNSAIKTAQKWGIIVCFFTMTLFETAAKPFVQFFMSTSSSSHEALETVSYAIIFLRIRCLVSLPMFMNYHPSFCMQAMGYGKGTMIHTVMRQLVFYIPYMFILNRLFGKYGLVSAAILGDICGAIAALTLLNRFIKKKEVQLSS